ncbi:GNAT family N-acetyltransferase [Tropicimonas sp. IMCC34043]|uniref:GNAT family N-acetyltransferase n=1 Tax=Tropicimonas sp. IMCC34043 TaxID=2248760 RepID=UPI000E27D4FD|nr:GNAT family N-acetyltransferase [Tropicimonas sp. IMCC34043]
MSDFSFEIEETDARHGRYVGRVEGIAEEAEITFTRRGPGVISADHTGAPEALRGTGIAAALVAHLVADARAMGFRIIPLCPYVRKQYARHPDWADVFTTAPGEAPALSG